MPWGAQCPDSVHSAPHFGAHTPLTGERSLLEGAEHEAEDVVEQPGDETLQRVGDVGQRFRRGMVGDDGVTELANRFVDPRPLVRDHAFTRRR